MNLGAVLLAAWTVLIFLAAIFMLEQAENWVMRRYRARRLRRYSQMIKELSDMPPGED